MHTFIAFLHHLSAFTVFACTLCAWALWRGPLTLSTARYLQRLERLNTPAATLVLVLGLLRVFRCGAGAVQNWLPWQEYRTATDAASPSVWLSPTC